MSIATDRLCTYIQKDELGNTLSRFVYTPDIKCLLNKYMQISNK